MKKSFYLITAAVLSLTTVNAQTVFDKDITITEPYEIADYNNSELM